MRLRKLGLITAMASASLLALSACGESIGIEVSFDSYSNQISYADYQAKVDAIFDEIENLESLTCTYKSSENYGLTTNTNYVYDVESVVNFKYNKKTDILYEESETKSKTKSDTYESTYHDVDKTQTEKVNDIYHCYDLLTNTYIEQSVYSHRDVRSSINLVTDVSYNTGSKTNEYYEDNGLLTAYGKKDYENKSESTGRTNVAKSEETVQIKKDGNKYTIRCVKSTYTKDEYEKYTRIESIVDKYDIVLTVEEPEIKPLDVTKFTKFERI